MSGKSMERLKAAWLCMTRRDVLVVKGGMGAVLIDGQGNCRAYLNDDGGQASRNAAFDLGLLVFLHREEGAEALDFALGEYVNYLAEGACEK